MKRSMIFGMAVSLVAPIGAQAQSHRSDEGHPADRGERQIMRLIESFDTNNDGAVDLSEAVAARADRLAEFDADGNGTLSLDEYKSLWVDAYFERMVDNFQRHDDNGDGEVTVDEFTQEQTRMITRADRNNDGMVDEKDAADRKSKR